MGNISAEIETFLEARAKKWFTLAGKKRPQSFAIEWAGARTNSSFSPIAKLTT